jgi:hypothetical protein
MPSFVLETSMRSILADELLADLDGGTLVITTAADAVLATIPLASPIGTELNGVITLDCALTTVAATGTGTAAKGKFYDAAGPTLRATGDVALAGATPTIVLDNLSINATQTITITSGTITVPAGI